tara:strand:- start:47 stop:793 length:747 start_codon:yes stop_codon:yes gene_type:complete
MIITLASNNDYINHCMCLIKSLRLNAGENNIRLYIRLVNVSSQNINKIRDLLNEEDIIIIDDKTLSPRKELLKQLTDTKHNIYDGDYKNLVYSEEMSYACHSRFQNICELIDRGERYIICMDADTIIRRDISGLINTVKDHEMVTGYYTDASDKIIFNEEGMIGITVTPNTTNFFTDVTALVMNDFQEWDIDGKALSEAYDRYDIDLYRLPVTFKDKSLLKNSHIWSGDGRVKMSDKYMDEYNKYLAI